MNTRTDIISQIENLLGSEGSFELAEAFFEAAEQNGYVTFDATNGYVLSEDDNVFGEILEMII